MTDEWITVWRLNRVTLNPEQIRVFPVSDHYVLVEGEDHTVYRGNVFDTPEKAFAAEEDDGRRSIRYGHERLKRVAQARERFEKQGGR